MENKFEELAKVFSKVGQDLSEKCEKIREINIDAFERALDQCPYDIQAKYNYINSELCECDDEMLEIIDRIEANKVEIEIIKRMTVDESEEKILLADTEITLLELENRRLQDRYKYIQERYDILYDLLEEEEINIMA